MDQTWNEIEKLMDTKKLNMNEVIKRAAVIQDQAQDNNSPADGLFRIRQLVGELYRHTCKAKVSKWNSPLLFPSDK